MYKYTLLDNFCYKLLVFLDGAHLSQPSACRYIKSVALGLQLVNTIFANLLGSAEKTISKSLEEDADYLNRHFYHH